MDKNSQDMLGGILGNLPGDLKEKVQNCKSKDDFMGIIGAGGGKGIDLSGLGGLLGGGSNDSKGTEITQAKADNNPLAGLGNLFGGGSGGFDLGGLVGQAGDFLKGVDWSEIKDFITGFFNKNK